MSSASLREACTHDNAMQQVYVKWCKWCAIRHCGIRRLRLAPLSFRGDEVDGLNGDVTDRCGQTLNLSWCLRPLGVAETPAPLSPRALQSSARRLAGLSSDSFSFGCLRHICTFEVVPTHSFRENNASGTRMSFVTLAGSTQDAPSFLELIAAHRLERGLRDAFSYALSIVAAHSPRQGLALLQWDSELYAASALIVQSTSLLSNDATLAESLYGLRRMPIAPAADSKSAKRLAPWQRLLSVLVVALGPYCAQRVFGDPAQPDLMPIRPPPASPQLHHDGTGGSAACPDAYGVRHSLRTFLTGALTTGTRGGHVARRHSHVAMGLLRVAYQLAYLLQLSPYFSPTLHLTQARLARDDGSATIRRGRLQAQRLTRQAHTRQRLWQHATARRSLPLLVASAALRVGHAVGNNTKTALMTGLLLFKVLEWWFTTAEAELEEAARVMPPPPPVYAPHTAGVPLPEDTSLCPVCKRTRTAPALLAVSGYVFCYKCALTAASQDGCCPVTRIRASPDDVRRLFLSA